MNANGRSVVVGNWKMNGVAAQLDELRRVDAALRADPPSARVVVCPPATLINRVAEIAAGGPMEVGAQDAHADTFGARTGDLNAEMLHDAGAALVLVGHSERRAHHRESDAEVSAKVQAALRAGLEPIVCVGETVDDRRAGQAEAVVEAQLAASLPNALANDLTRHRFAVGYEPIWAVGTGLTPSDAEICAMHETLCRLTRARFGVAVPILYGGSVQPANARRILALPGVGGALVGGASLQAEAFLAIVRAV